MPRGTEKNGTELSLRKVEHDTKHLFANMYIEIFIFFHIDCGEKAVLKVCDNLGVMELSFGGSTAVQG